MQGARDRSHHVLTWKYPERGCVHLRTKSVVPEATFAAEVLIVVRETTMSGHGTTGWLRDSEEEMMRAVTVNRFGEAPSVRTVSLPDPGPGQVLIKLAAAGMNPMDAKLASGEWTPAPATFPMVLGVDGAGVVETLGEGTTRFSPGDRVFGQLFIAPIGSSGTYADYVAVTGEAPLALVPEGLDLVVAAAAPTAGATGLSLVELVEPIDDQVMLIVGAGGGVGAFTTQFAVSAGARVIANAHSSAGPRMQSYGVEKTIDHTAVSLEEAVRNAHPDGVDILIDLVGDAEAFASAASLVRPGGTAVTTQYVADLEALQVSQVRGVNFALRPTSQLMETVGRALADGTILEPPITRIALDDVPSVFASLGQSHANGKTVIVL
jgi:NADPH2:quinone reductase